MLVFSQRPSAYKVGLLILLMGLVLYVMGFSSPFWTIDKITFHWPPIKQLNLPSINHTVLGHNGLWQTCSSNFKSRSFVILCHSVSSAIGHSVWISTVQGLQNACLIGVILTCVHAVVVNFVQRSPDITKRYTEVLLIASGVTGFIGTVIYALESYARNDVLNVKDIVLQTLAYTIDKNDLAWAFYLDVLGCLLFLLSAVLLCAHNRLIQPRDSAPVLGVAFSSSDGGLVFLSPPEAAGDQQARVSLPNISRPTGDQQARVSLPNISGPTGAGEAYRCHTESCLNSES